MNNSNKGSLIESRRIGPNTTVLPFSHIMPGATIGDNCKIYDHVVIENNAVIGDNVVVGCGVQIWDSITLEDNVFIGPNVTFSNAKYPMHTNNKSTVLKTVICKGAFIGANATILPGLTIGRDALIGAGSVVTKNVPPKAIVQGNPAYISGYVDSIIHKDAPIQSAKDDCSCPIQPCSCDGATIHRMPTITDIRGSLSFAEYGQFLPFEVKRYFIVYDVPGEEVRGEHAHKELHQFLVCVKGSCCVVLDDGENREEISLNSPSIGLHIPPMMWAIQYKYSRDAVLVVFASDIYNADDYIEDYDDFLKNVRPV